MLSMREDQSMKTPNVASHFLIASILVGWCQVTQLFAQGHVDITTKRLPAYLNGQNQTPPNQSSIVAVAAISYVPSLNPFSTTAVKCQIDLPMGFEPTDAGIYGPASLGQNGSLMFALGTFVRSTNIFEVIAWPETQPSYVTNISHSSTNVLNFSYQAMQLLESKQCYINISSAEYPSGEIRGQISKSPVLGGVLNESGGRLSFNVAGPLASNYRIEVSTNLSNWNTVTNFSVTTNFFRITVTNSSSDPACWYRVLY